MGTEPLAGIRILDLTNVLAGPYACYQLALLGAEVIKVERPDGGDLARELGADPCRNAEGMGISFLAQNGGKQSITLNLKHPKGKQLLKRLVETADVLVENFRTGVMARLGMDYESLKSINPSLIYCAISGFGQTGPMADAPAYDQIVQGVSGVMSITGDRESAPLRVGYPLADTMGGMTAAFAITSALNAPERGTFLDISMTEAVISSMGWVVSNHLIGGVTPEPMGNDNMTSAPSGTFATADTPINIAANKDSQWQALADHLGLSHLIHDPRFATREVRKKNRAALTIELEHVLTTRTAGEWVAELNAKGVPTGPVNTVAQTLDSEQMEARGIVDHTHEIPLLRSPIIYAQKRPSPKTTPPRLGADNMRIYGNLGLSGTQIKNLEQDGVI